MTIHVTASADYGHRAFPDATGWHVDDTGQLHITKTGSGNVASFHPGAWAAVERSAESAPKTTAVVTLHTKGESSAGQKALNFIADYSDERNKAWAKYTPGLSAQMHVTDAVAERFEQGGRYLLTFQREE
ncbi:hypothetical protein ACFFGR_09250 [Arthrobacter liuii]|uniref:Uncharacterized protein n=1 Tax=Arthrobacter liuii TaxID=1476996 RepID=A0ABQ2ALW8_9MICC|nr:hypothetical protein [Arthrobacter liuii]GGH93793.1 hypothetical protein GCM10007170_15490 [Arthrobacter liuii]